MNVIVCLHAGFIPKKKKKKKTGLQSHVTPLEDISVPYVLIFYNQLQFNSVEAIVPGVKRSELDADHSPPSGFEVKNSCNYNSKPPTCLHGVCRENFHF